MQYLLLDSRSYLVVSLHEATRATVSCFSGVEMFASANYISLESIVEDG